MTRFLRAGLMALVVVMMARAVSAQVPCASTQADSPEELAGQQAFREDRYDAAVASFEAAHRVCPRSLTATRAAIAHIAAGHWEEAHGWMQRVLAQRNDAWVAGHREYLEQQRALIMQNVGELTVTGTGGPGEVLVSGRRVADFPMTEAVGIEPGVVVVRVRWRSGETVERSVQIVVGRRDQITVTPSRDSRTLRLVLAGTSAGLAAVGLGVGIWASVDGADRRSTYDRECPTGHPLSLAGHCDALLERVSDAQTAQVAGFVTGGVLVVTSAVLFATLPSRASSARAFMCGPGPGAVGIGCTVRF